MSVAKEALEARLLQINEAIEKMMADVNAAIGRREEVKFQIAQIVEAEANAKLQAEAAAPVAEEENAAG